MELILLTPGEAAINLQFSHSTPSHLACNQSCLRLHMKEPGKNKLPYALTLSPEILFLHPDSSLEKVSLWSKGIVFQIFFRPVCPATSSIRHTHISHLIQFHLYYIQLSPSLCIKKTKQQQNHNLFGIKKFSQFKLV